MPIMQKTVVDIAGIVEEPFVCPPANIHKRDLQFPHKPVRDVFLTFVGSRSLYVFRVSNSNFRCQSVENLLQDLVHAVDIVRLKIVCRIPLLSKKRSKKELTKR